MRRAVLALALATATLAAGCSGLADRQSMNEGHRHYKAERYEQAAAAYERILTRQPNHYMATYMTALSYMALYHPGSTHIKDWEYCNKAIGAFEKCLSLRAPSVEMRDRVRAYYLALLTSAERTDRAANYLQTMLEKDPGNQGLMMQLAGIYAKKGDVENALKYYTQRANAEPGNKEAWYTIGVVCWERVYRGGVLVPMDEKERLVAMGVEALNKALALDKDYFDALAYANLIHREKQKVLLAFGKEQEALEAYQKAEDYKARAMELAKKRQAAGAPATGA